MQRLLVGGPVRLVSLVFELADPDRHAAFVQNVLLGWRALLGADLAPRLVALWDGGCAAGDAFTRALLAWAAADADPSRRRELLTAGLALAPSVASTRLLEPFSSEHAADEPRLIERWFTLAASDTVPEDLVTSCQEAILHGLARATPPPRGLLHRLVMRLSPDAPAVVDAALAAATALGCTPPAGTCAALGSHLGKGGGPNRAAEEARAARARADCIAALRRCPPR